MTFAASEDGLDRLGRGGCFLMVGVCLWRKRVPLHHHYTLYPVWYTLLVLSLYAFIGIGWGV